MVRLEYEEGHFLGTDRPTQYLNDRLKRGHKLKHFAVSYDPSQFSGKRKLHFIFEVEDQE